jgi:LemA protein
MNSSKKNHHIHGIETFKVRVFALLLSAVYLVKPANGQVLPSDWQVTGLGNGGRLVSDALVNYDNGTWSVKTGRSRSAIVCKNFDGDVSVVLKITDATGQQNAAVGIMMWSSLSPTAGKAGLVLDPQGQHLYFSWDEVSDRPEFYRNFIQCEGIGFPVWLKLTRSGGYFSGFYSKDGQDWQSVGFPIKTFWASERSEMFAGIYADGVCEQRVTDLQAMAVPTAPLSGSLPDDWDAEIHGQPDFIGHADYVDGQWTLAGANISGRGGFHNVTVLKSVPSEVQLTTQIQTSDLDDPRTGGGLLLSAHGLDVGVMAFPAGGVISFFTRQTLDGRTIHSREVPIPSAMTSQPNAFLRLVLFDGKVTAFYATDTNNWIQIDQTSPLHQMATDVAGGMELYSLSGSHFASSAGFSDFQASSVTASPGQGGGIANATPAWTVEWQNFHPGYYYWPGNGQKPSDAQYFSNWDDFNKRNIEITGQSKAQPQQGWTGRSTQQHGSGHFFWVLLVWVVIMLTVVGIVGIAIPFNRLVYLRNRASKAWAQIDVQLKRRHDLIFNIIEVVKGYAKHEGATLENVTRARADAANADTIGERAKAETVLNSNMKALYTIVEAYPDLKANQSFLSLQQNLTATENWLAATRNAYNEEILTYNTAVQSFPTNLIAMFFGFRERDFFELKEVAERESPKARM